MKTLFTDKATPNMTSKTLFTIPASGCEKKLADATKKHGAVTGIRFDRDTIEVMFEDRATMWKGV